jgi:hypothetical protein
MVHRFERTETRRGEVAADVRPVLSHYISTRILFAHHSFSISAEADARGAIASDPSNFASYKALAVALGKKSRYTVFAPSCSHYLTFVKPCWSWRKGATLV